MNQVEIRAQINQKLDELSPEQLSLVMGFLDFLRYQPQSKERKPLVERWRKLLKETQALHTDNQLTEAEIAAEIEAYCMGE